MARARRVCPRPGCPAFMPCVEHARPSSNARGYTHQHRKLRDDWAPRVAAGQVVCWRCGELIKPGSEWHLGHIDGSAEYGGPEHARECNLHAAGKAAHERQ